MINEKQQKNYSVALAFLRAEFDNDFAFLSKIDSGHVAWLREFVKHLPEQKREALCTALVARAHPDVAIVDPRCNEVLTALLATTDRIPLVESRGSTSLLKEYLDRDLAGICLVPIQWFGSHCTTQAVMHDLRIKVELDLGGRWSRAAFFTRAFLKNQRVEWMQTSILSWIGLAGETAWQGDRKEDEISKQLSEVLGTWIKWQAEILA